MKSKIFICKYIFKPVENLHFQAGGRKLYYLLKKHWTLFVINDANKRFLTSDNPVTFLGHDGIIDDKNEIIFPVNEKMLIHMNNKKLFNSLEVISGRSRFFNHSFLRELSIKIAYGSYSHIFCSNEKLLKSIIDDYLLIVKKRVGVIRYNI